MRFAAWLSCNRPFRHHSVWRSVMPSALRLMARALTKRLKALVTFLSWIKALLAAITSGFASLARPSNTPSRACSASRYFVLSPGSETNCCT
ncbi:hypothetical protein D3C86_1572720 [compost metagenome]